MNSIQKKIWVLVAVVLFMMAGIWIALTYYNQQTQDQYNAILQRYLNLNDVKNLSAQVVSDLNDYLIKPSERQIERYQQSKAKLVEVKYEVYKLRSAENNFTLTNYIHMIDRLLESSDIALMFHKRQEVEDSTQAFAEAARISKYISEMTLTLLNVDLKSYVQFYRGIIEQSEKLNALGIWVLLTLTFFLILFTYGFSSSITRPIELLTQAARQFAKGRFDQPVEIKSNDEIAFLAKMFERMRVNMTNFISEMQLNAQLESELQQNKLLLQESQLRSLQSQINPHFLFNTLDTLSKKAFLEGAEETSDLLVNVAGLLRYNLKRIDRAVTLADEVRVMQQYLEIQKARFTDRLKLEIQVDQACLSAMIPGLTLQPIIENAVIHAVETNEDGGSIRINIRKQQDRIRIEIEDDGPGMSREKIDQILNEESADVEGHSTGIGLSNVMKRLRLFYGETHIMQMESGTLGRGTNVILNIPEQRGTNGNAQNLDRR